MSVGLSPLYGTLMLGLATGNCDFAIVVYKTVGIAYEATMKSLHFVRKIAK